MLVTWIAPTAEGLPELAWLSELGRLEKINDVTVITRTGKVTLEDVATVLRDPVDVLIFSSHGIAGGLMLSDKKIIRSKWLAAQVIKSRPKAVILAACGSQDRDAGLHSLTEAVCRAGVNVIGFPADANDHTAATFTIEFVRAITAGISSIEAFAVAMESIQEEETARGIFYTPGAHDIPIAVATELATIAERLSRIEEALALQAPMRQNDAQPKAPISASGGLRPLSREVPTGHIQGITRGDT